MNLIRFFVGLDVPEYPLKTFIESCGSYWPTEKPVIYSKKLFSNGKVNVPPLGTNPVETRHIR